MKSDGRQQAESRGCFQRVLRGCGWTLLVIVVLLLTCYFVEVYRCSRFTPTGDALFDKYARAVIKRQAWRLFHSGQNHPATLPDELLAGWESEFGKDPRYWQLRYWCSLYRHSGPSWYWDRAVGSEDYLRALAFLEEGRIKGVSDVDTLFVQYAATSALISMNYVEPEGESVNGIAKLDALVAELASSGAEYSWAHYAIAYDCIREEDNEGALTAIRAGNAREDNHWPLCFPETIVTEQCTQSDPPNRVLYGAILNLDYQRPASWHNTYGRKHDTYLWQMKEFLQWVVANGEEGDMTACHRFACRVGSAEGSDFWFRKAPTMIITMVDAALEWHGDEYSAKQRKALLTLASRVRRLRSSLKCYETEAETAAIVLEASGTSETYKGWVYFTPSVFEDSDLHTAANAYFWNHPDGWRLITHLRSHALRLHGEHTWDEFESFAEFDWSTLDLPNDW